MKKYFFLFLIGLSLNLILQAQINKTINVSAGTLFESLTIDERNLITSLTITGTIDARDFKTMRDKMPLLAKLDLSGATIAAYIGSEGTSMLGNTNYPANNIPQYAFSKNTITTSLTSIIFPPSITFIDRNAFYQCAGLKDIVIPSMVTTLEMEAFYGCSGLTSVIISSSVISFRKDCFASCIKLTSITMESSIPPYLNSFYEVFTQVDKSLCILNVPYLSAEAYRNAYVWKDFQNIVEAINGFNISSNNVKVNGTIASTATIDIDSNIQWTASSDQNWLVVNPVSGEGLSQTLTFTADANPSFIASRTAYVTISASGSASQIITVNQKIHPQSKTLEATAGDLASALTAEELATITDLTLTGNIDARDFKTMRDKMPLLAKLDLTGVNIVAYNGTEGTNSIGIIKYPANTIPEYAFVTTEYGLAGKNSLSTVMLPEFLIAIGQYSFTSCYAMNDVIIPSSVTEIGSYAFFGCTWIKTIAIPSSVTTIGIQAFGKIRATINVDPGNLNYMSGNNVLFNKTQTELINSSLLISGNYEIPSTVTSICDYAFSECVNLTSVTIPSSVTSIGNYSFNYCRGLSSINIPSSVTHLGASAFAMCNGLKTIYANSITPVDLNSSLGVFYQVGTNKICYLYVPIGSKGAYQVANQWKDFKYIIEVNPDLIAFAGEDQIINEGTLVTLEGSDIVNTSGKSLTYHWTAPEGITLSSKTEQYPTFTAPEVTSYTNFTFTLTISDGLIYSETDEIVIQIRNVSKPPVANAGIDQTVNKNSMVTLDGSASYDPENKYLSYEWTAPYPISLSSEYSSKPTFKSPEVTTDTDFTFYLRVMNGYYSTTDTVVITVKQVNKTPIANAGTYQYKNEGEVVTLDGTASMDADGDALTYLWTAPAAITLNSNTSASPYFTAPRVKTDTRFTFTLVVNDGKLNSASTGVGVMVRHIYPILNLTANANNLTATVYLNYKLFMKEENSFIQKIDTFSITGDTIHLSVEPGEWIVLASPARDTSAFVPTYVGDVLDWNEAEIISMDNNSNIFKKITFIIPEIAKTGVGQILGIVYENPDNGAKSVSISKTNITFSNPVQQVLVRLYRKGSELPVASVFTDSLGAYSFDKLDLSDYEIVIELPGYIQSDKFTLALSANEPVATANFGVNTSSQVITDHKSLELSLLKIYPNPTNGTIHISGLPEKTETKISIYTIDGKKAMEKKTNLISETIDISNQISGTYILVLNNQRFKIVKK